MAIVYKKQILKVKCFMDEVNIRYNIMNYMEKMRIVSNVSTALRIIFSIACLVCLYLSENIISPIICILMAWLIAFVNDLVIQPRMRRHCIRLIDAVALKSLKPALYENILNTYGLFYYDMRMISEYLNGNYSTAAKIATTLLDKLEKKKSKNYFRQKHFFQISLCGQYFETNNVEMLKSEVYKLKENYTNVQEKLPKHACIIEFYEKYCEEDYLACKDICIKNKSDDNQEHYFLNEVRWFLRYAVTCYKLGEFETATQYFKKIIEIVPEGHFMKISSEYLLAIEENREYVFKDNNTPVNEELLNLIFPPKKAERKRLIIKTISIIVYILVMILSIIGIAVLSFFLHATTIFI